MKQVTDLKIILKDFERIVKWTDHKWRLWLVNWNNEKFKTDSIPVEWWDNFNLRYREAWANRILCATSNFVNNWDYTFNEDLDGDWIIVDRKNNIEYKTEHVASMKFYKWHKIVPGEKNIVEAINKKIDKWPEYSKWKFLITFCDWSWKFYPNKVWMQIKEKHNFQWIFLIVFLSWNNKFYKYSVSFLKKEWSTTFIITIDWGKLTWNIKRYQ